MEQWNGCESALWRKGKADLTNWDRLLYVTLHANACVRENSQIVLSHRIGLRVTCARTMLYTRNDARLTPDVVIGLA